MIGSGRRLRVAVGLMAAALAIAACKQDQPEAARPNAVTETAEARDAISEPLMLALGQAKNFHGKADVYLKSGDIESALVEIEKILDIDFPPGSAEAEDVRLDARARLASLRLTRGDVSGAETIVNEGIAEASRESFFLANLHTVRGEVLEARADALAESGDDSNRAAAAKLRLQAIAAFDRSIAINEALQRKLVEEPGR